MTEKVERQVNQQLRQSNEKGKIDAETCKKLNPCHTHIPYMYGLPKLHKEQVFLYNPLSAQ